MSPEEFPRPSYQNGCMYFNSHDIERHLCRLAGLPYVKPDAPGVLVRASAFAKRLGVSRRTVGDRVQKMGCSQPFQPQRGGKRAVEQAAAPAE